MEEFFSPGEVGDFEPHIQIHVKSPPRRHPVKRMCVPNPNKQDDRSVRTRLPVRGHGASTVLAGQRVLFIHL